MLDYPALNTMSGGLFPSAPAGLQSPDVPSGDPQFLLPPSRPITGARSGGEKGSWVLEKEEKDVLFCCLPFAVWCFLKILFGHETFLFGFESLMVCGLFLY